MLAVRRLRETPLHQVHHYAVKYGRQLYAKKVRRQRYLPVWGPRYPGLRDDLATTDLLTVIARQWAEGSRQAEAALAEFDDGAVLRLRYEDFVADPVAHLERVAAHCGLTVTEAMATAARVDVAPDRTRKWERFEPEELARLVPELRDEMQRHGYEVPGELQLAGAGRGSEGSPP